MHLLIYRNRLIMVFLLGGLLQNTMTFLHAQEASESDSADDTPVQRTAEVDITVVASRELVAFDPVNSGRTIFTESAISVLIPGFGDPNLLFETLPNVQYDGNQDRLTNSTVQDLSPSQFSISGGRVYDNQFVINGVGINSVMDSVSRNPNNFNEVVGHPQTVFLEASLLEQAAIFDSNIPAEFGGFTGGVVDFRVRSPQPKFGFSTSYSRTSSAWTQYRVNENNRTDPMPARPEFVQDRFDLRFDVPLSASVGALFAFTRSTARVSKAPDQSLFGDSIRSSTSTRDNYLAKVRWDVNADTRLTFQTLWTPYEQEFLRFNTDIFRGGGTSSFIELDHVFDFSELTVRVFHNTSDTSRSSDPVFFMLLNTDSIDWVPDGSRTAQKGGFGNLDVTQRDFGLDITQSFLMGSVDFRLGMQAARIRAFRSRPETNFTFRNGIRLGDSIGQDGSELRVRLAPDVDLSDPSIIAGEQILTQRIDYLAHEANVYLTTFGLWGEASKDLFVFNRLETSLRWGLRYDYDAFLGNHNFGPRLSTVFKLPRNMALTLGANRYYSRNMVAYKLRESYPDEFVYERLPVITREFSPDFTRIIETRTYSDVWTLRDHNRSPRYSQADLDTPYSDELSAALTFPLLQGQARVRVLQRRNRAEFARSEGFRDTFVGEDGRERTFTNYFITNRGFTNFESLVLEWQRTWRSYVFDINTTLSRTENGGANSFFSVIGDGDDIGNEQVFYNGRVLPFNELSFIRDNFATPMVVNANLTRGFNQNKFVINLNFRYRAPFDSVEALLIRNADNSAFINQTVVVNGETFDVYGDVRNAGVFRLNSNLSWRFLETRHGTWSSNLRIRNLTNSIPNTTATATNPYQRGRSFWFEVKYTF